MEFAVEVKKLLELSLEGAVGNVKNIELNCFYRNKLIIDNLDLDSHWQKSSNYGAEWL